MKFVVWIAVGLCPAILWAEGWVYQLQNPNPRALARAGFDVAVMDYSKDGTAGTRFKRAEVRKMQRKGVEALAYFSIGEAEGYRFYWDPDWVGRRDSNEFTALAPDWLGRTNPDWAGNYKVRYWDPEWRATALEPYLDQIIAAGFNGVYLDIVDGFEYWSDRGSYGPGKETRRPDDPIGDEREAALRMIDLVKWIADYGRANSKFGRKFQVFPQNGENLVRYDQGGKFLRAIAGLGVEDVFFDETERQPKRETNFRLRGLKKVVKRGKLVLCVDYVDDGRRGAAQNEARIGEFLSKCERYGFEAYVANEDRELDSINRIPGLQPRR